MSYQNVLVTGEELFLKRHKYLFTQLSNSFKRIDYLPIGYLYEPKNYRRFRRLLYCLNHGVSLSNSDGFFKNSQAFIKRSQKLEKEIQNLDYKPDLVFHLFSLCCPFWNNYEIPYTMYLDYTMALAQRNYPPFAPFQTDKEFKSWLECENKSYEQAQHIFTMSNLVKNSLVTDYNISTDKVTVIGASGNFAEPYMGEKAIGSQQILFNGSDFDRKGGDVVLDAFKMVKKVFPKAKLVVIGKKLTQTIDGVENPGDIRSEYTLQNLFLQSDLVVAPARCEPFGVFLVEAMNYGVPCIVSSNDANGITDFLADGVDSIIINQPNPEDLAHHIINLFKNCNVLKSISKAAQNKVRSQLNWNKISDQVLQVLLA
ncbi:hypothetical protein DSM106972_054130 [Dulcicalothrix desertica PCC 7102]|uniref:Glycosyl transferase family 1 domain-containing protein n=1 Tax=Dulcicalothrix desertica PCC 7102 TaxID=232991 RepID=A0A433VAG7_9CYAN|nr:glycosyltransferase family 4 protein [Dulcicalothrix desertica]RUT03105.1 hypothetical protein DSM106972_054130 [Dulcicalothrix desertica PCC 7102]TWH53480.1 glycosyltransferase involved in cell wall biosynthesis [Dulcicalothrix desertica PCC 7102]